MSLVAAAPHSKAQQLTGRRTPTTGELRALALARDVEAVTGLLARVEDLYRLHSTEASPCEGDALCRGLRMAATGLSDALGGLVLAQAANEGTATHGEEDAGALQDHGALPEEGQHGPQDHEEAQDAPLTA